jgi:hypothetical protein
MTLEKRIRVLSISIVAITFAEGLLGLIALIEGSSLAHVALIHGTQWLLVVGLAISSRKRLKKELQARSAG